MLAEWNLLWMVALGLVLGAVAAEEPRRLKLDRLHGATFRFGGVLGERARVNVESWLLVAPKNNPGLLDMFARRDSGQKPDLVPWAGEFVGKYLISGVQAMRMSDDPRLRDTLASVVARLIELQAEDGYLGPWPKDERLLGHWDLWGHYHVMLALMLWHEHTGDENALAAARRMADLICRTYLDTGRRVFDAGSHEMNMSVLHGLGRLHRETGEPRYLRMAEEVLKDFERAGDYFRTGLAGVEFFRTPRPRWESLHALQGLVELYRITGDERFRRSFLHHWASIRRFDLRNTGGFSSGEQATGDPFANTPIETCCVVAWQAVMIDALRLTGDPTIADDIELATFNAIAGAQHPSGAWFTYDTPMNGKRVPSHVAIQFQARPDAPHLNCCSANGPRGLGALSEWAVMQLWAAGPHAANVRGTGTSRPQCNGLAVHFYGPMQARLALPDGTPVLLAQETSYPIGDTVALTLEPAKPAMFPLALRIPAWSARTKAWVNGEEIAGVRPGAYLELARPWKRGDRVTLRFDMALRYEAGDLDAYGLASLYRGPILLAYDERLKLKPVPSIDVARLPEAKLVAAPELKAWLVVQLPAADGTPVRLCDFASAGATGGSYRSWLPATGLRPPAPVPWQPADGSRLPPGPIRFTFRGPAAAALSRRRHTVVISDTPTFDDVVLAYGDAARTRLVVPAKKTEGLQPDTVYYWKAVASNASGQTESLPPHKRFVIDPALPPAPDLSATQYGERAKDKALVVAPLRGDPKPDCGQLKEAQGWRPAPGPDGKPKTAVELDGQSGRLLYALAGFPERDCTVALWVAVQALPKTSYGQVFSAWCRGMDDPLRLVVHGGKLHARIEAAQFYGTEGVPVEIGKWMHIVAVKHGPKLTLWVNGESHASAKVPDVIVSFAEDFALGGNPHFGGPEFLAVRLADLRVYARALSAAEIREACRTTTR